MDWNIHKLRATFFHTHPINITESQWWEDVFDEIPESQVLKKRGQEKIENGNIDDIKAEIRIQPLRTDLYIESIEKPIEDDNPLTSIGSFNDIDNIFLQYVFKWVNLNNFLQTNRIAFGAILHQPVKDIITGYKLLQSMLPAVKIDSKTSSDFLYQINRARISNVDIPDLKINRLTKWSVATVKFLGLHVVADIKQEDIIRKDFFACQLELDINTSEDFTSELPKEKIKDIFKELVSLGNEIGSEGDIA